MPITVEQLVSTPGLGTRVVSGAAGLSREIGWAHVCELPSPWEWVGQGDLLMTTGLGVPAGARRQVAYVERLAGVGASGVAIGENMHAPPLTKQMLAAADATGLPVLLTRYEIPFIALARTVAEASQREEQARIEQTVRVYELLRRTSVAGLPLRELLAALAEVVSCDLIVADPGTGRSLLTGARVPDPLGEAIVRWGSQASDERPVVLHLDGGDGAGILMPGPRPALLVALARDGHLPDSTVLRHLTAVTAVHQSWVFAERERARRLGASLLAQLVDQRMERSIARAQLAERGLSAGPLILMACAEAGNGEELHYLHHVLDDAGASHLMLSRLSMTYVLMLDDPVSIEILTAGLPPGSAVGVSDPFIDLQWLPAAQHQAHWALNRAQDRKLAFVRHSDDFGGSLFLPATREDSYGAGRRVLGQLIDYDTQHGSELVPSLRAFLEENRSWQRASARLHVHKQTLVYRIARVEALIGRSLSDTADVAELWLGLQAAAASGLIEQAPSGPRRRPGP